MTAWKVLILAGLVFVMMVVAKFSPIPAVTYLVAALALVTAIGIVQWRPKVVPTLPAWHDDDALDCVGLLEVLARLNVAIRLAELPGPERDAMEQCIDRMRTLLTVLNADHEGNDLTRWMNPLAERHFRRRVRAYLELDPSARTRRASGMMSYLEALGDELESIEGLTQAGMTGDFVTKAAMLSRRFAPEEA